LHRDVERYDDRIVRLRTFIALRIEPVPGAAFLNATSVTIAAGAQAPTQDQ
jgi:hypothetical protein